MTPQEKAAETRQQHQEARDRKRNEWKEERELIRASMKTILQNPSATPGERLRAAKILLELET
jgi:hypothetical protein